MVLPRTLSVPSSWSSLINHIISHQKHLHSTLKPRWEAPLNLLLVGTAFAFHVFWLFELNRPGQENRPAVQEWCGEHFNGSIPNTVQVAFQADFMYRMYILTIIVFCLIGVFLHCSGDRILTGSYSLPFQLCSLCCLTLVGGVHVATKAGHFSADVQDLFPKHQQCKLRAWL